jgi:threonine dehydrogenase-like Zn-dependent dehydrogenase
MTTQKGVAITGKGKVELTDVVYADTIVPTGARIKPLIWSPCTSDVHQCETGCATLPYLIGKATGHEMVGEVTEVGPEVKDFKVGDIVTVCAVMPHWRSMEAQACKATATSDNMYRGIDYPDRGGVFCESYYIRDADMNLGHVPDNVTLEQAVMVPDMMMTTTQGVKELNIGWGDSVCVFGIGPVGLTAIQLCAIKGAGRIIAVGSRPHTFEIAKENGATDFIDYHDADYLEKIIAANGGEKLSKVLICGGDVETIDAALQLVGFGATVISLTAFFSGKNIEFSPSHWGFGYGDIEIKGVGCDGGRFAMENCIKLIQFGRVHPENIITHRFHGMDKIPEAFQLFLDHDRSLIKPVIYND